MGPEPRDLHVGRFWPGMGNELEQQCSCPKERCGLVAVAKVDPGCPQHSMQAAKTMRQMHYADECPARPALVRFAAEIKKRARQFWAEVGMALGFGPHADGQARSELVNKLRWAASHYLCIGQWFWNGKDDCHKCGTQPGDVDFLMKRSGWRKAECIDA